MFHLLGSAYLEGLIVPNSRFTVYPSHKPGKISPTLAGFLTPASRLLGGFFRPGLLTRVVEAADTSRERYYARLEGRSANDSFDNQTDTVHINPEYRNLIRTSNRNILVFDDFTTTGKSLEWARNLLYAGGADRVVLLTIGKYVRGGSPTYSLHEAVKPDLITPYELNDYDEADFTRVSYNMNRDPSAQQVLKDSFQYFRDDKMYPVELTN